MIHGSEKASFVLRRINNHTNCLCSLQQGVGLEFHESKQVTAGLHMKGLWLCLGKEDCLLWCFFTDDTLVYELKMKASNE